MKKAMRTLLAGAGVAVLAHSEAAAGGLTLAHSFPESHPGAIWAESFARCAEESVGVYFEVLGGGALGAPSEIVDGVLAGHLGVAIVPLWTLSTRAPSLNALAIPGVTGEVVSLAERSESEAFLTAINEATQSEGLPVQVLALGWDFASLVGTRAALASPAGSRMIPDSPATAALFTAVGVEPVRMNWAEVASALQYGATDGAVLPTELASDLVRSGAVEAIVATPDLAPFAAPYLLIIGEQVSRDLGDSVPDALRAACQAPAGAFTETNLEMHREFESAAIETGTENVGESSEVRMVWEDAMRASSADWRSGLGIGNHLLDALGVSE